ncbi:MAG: 23S rRNA-specific endonuclease VapC20 [Nitrosomonadaceae bacterium]|nr:23S rRNA-specific endonuclease VapC20 [Nitrosomonadaceae bacterium]
MSSRPFLPQSSRRVLVDSSGFLAAFNPRDDRHQEGRAIWNALIQQRFSLYTTNFLIAEAHNLFIVRVGHQQARTFLRNATESTIRTIRVRASDEEQARAIVFRYTDKDYSLVDGTSFVIMERLGIPYAFTFDDHFSQYGKIVLTPELLH